jgi:oxygen-dependent protoporphyrinogen oxidase
MVVQSDNLTVDLAYDDHNAAEEFAPLGAGFVEYVMRSMFEGPFFTRLDTLSAAMVRLWLRAIQGGRFFQVKGGMDAPWLRLAERMDVRTGHPVETLRAGAQWVELAGSSSIQRYDGVVLAAPAPAAARIMAHEPHLPPPWLDEVRYAPQVRVYAARQIDEEARFGVHLLPPQTLFSVEHYSGAYGAWGACPSDWQWGLLCTYGAACAPLLERRPQEVIRLLWDEGRKVTPALFALEEADVVHYIRWEWAVPILGPGHYRRLASYRNRPPVVFAGDWMNQACVEGAVRSGEAAAEAIMNG